MAETEKEKLHDIDLVDRWLEYPRMTSNNGDIVDLLVFPFRDESPESVVWRKYASIERVHKLGIEKINKDNVDREEKNKKEYLGAREARVENIRNIKSGRGNGFDVLHEPGKEGLHHAEVIYDKHNEPLSKAEKRDLKMSLYKAFSTFYPPPPPTTAK